MLESLFTKIGVLQACNFIKKRPQRNCFPLNIAKSLRAAILENYSSICVANLLHTVWFSDPLGYLASRLGTTFYGRASQFKPSKTQKNKGE